MIATEWKEFKEIDWQSVYDQMSKPAFVFDGRMILDAAKLKEIGFTVSSLYLDVSLGVIAHAMVLSGQDDWSWRPPVSFVFTPVRRTKSHHRY